MVARFWEMRENIFVNTVQVQQIVFIIVRIMLPRVKNQGGARPLTILIAAPNLIIARGIKAMLSGNNYFLHEYIGRADELPEKSNVSADLLIIDADSPESFGISIIKKIKAKYPDMKIIIVNKLHQLPDSVKSVMQAGADGCISRYAEESPLAESIESVMQGEQYLCPLCRNEIAELFLKSTSGKEKEKLTEQEKKIMGLLAQEHHNIEIAEEMHISLRTVETHRKHIMKKIGARSLAGIALYAINNNLLK
jgi:DNA-binding NarL/FixJ family response regulator